MIAPGSTYGRAARASSASRYRSRRAPHRGAGADAGHLSCGQRRRVSSGSPFEDRLGSAAPSGWETGCRSRHGADLARRLVRPRSQVQGGRCFEIMITAPEELERARATLFAPDVDDRLRRWRGAFPALICRRFRCRRRRRWLSSAASSPPLKVESRPRRSSGALVLSSIRLPPRPALPPPASTHEVSLQGKRGEVPTQLF